MSLRDELQSIYDKHGYLTPGLVVEAARPKSSPLHGFVFAKDTKAAAEAWYLDRAQRLIQSFKVTYREATDKDPAAGIRQWQPVRTEQGHVYRSSDDVAADPLLREMRLRDMEREWRALHRRYAEFAEFVDMVRASIDAA